MLDFENAQIAHSNGKSLTKLLGEAKDENAKMIVLAVCQSIKVDLTLLTVYRNEALVTLQPFES